MSGSLTISFMQVANLVGYVIGPSGINSLGSRFLNKQGSLLVTHKNLSFFYFFLWRKQLSNMKKELMKPFWPYGVTNFYRISCSWWHVCNVLCGDKGNDKDLLVLLKIKLYCIISSVEPFVLSFIYYYYYFFWQLMFHIRDAERKR